MNQINTTDMTTNEARERYYEFQAPSNMSAIRSSIIQRIKQRNVTKRSFSSPPPHSYDDKYNEKHSYSALDNGLPSPPIETCTYEENEKLATEMVLSALLELTQEMPPSPVMSKASSESSGVEDGDCTPLLESSRVYREKIRLLKEEKHKLFQVMKDLLSKPAVAPVGSPIAMAAAAPVSANPNTNPTMAMATTTTTQIQQTRPRSSSRDDDNLLKSRPIARSRSISHTDTTSTRPISRYYSNSSSSSGSRHSYYPYSRNTSFSSAQPLSSISMVNLFQRQFFYLN
jgi:hypothetical protein